MADDVKITNWPQDGRHRVAYDLMAHVKTHLPKKEGVARIEQILLLMSACYDAAGGSGFDVSKLS